jgi:iron complex transport system substrate-binding protein
MVHKNYKLLNILLSFILFLSGCCISQKTGLNSAVKVESIILADSVGRKVEVPHYPERLLCSGSGCLRYLVYMQKQGLVVGVDDIEHRSDPFDARPYAMANPQFKELPVFGSFRGFDNPEQILSLTAQPQLIFKTRAEMGMSPDNLQTRTGIPVFTLDYGNLSDEYEAFVNTVMIMGKILGSEKRAVELVDFISGERESIKSRMQKAEGVVLPRSYIGGVAFKGPHGLESTECDYPPFVFAGIENVAAEACAKTNQEHVVISREKLLEWDPDIIFMDLATIRKQDQTNALYQLRNDPVLRVLKAVKKGSVYGVLPYNWYNQNHGSTLANAWFVSATIFPSGFADIDLSQKADQIFQFMVGKALFTEFSNMYSRQVFQKLDMNSSK